MTEVKVRRLEPDDFEKDFLESLSALTVVDLTPEQAREVYKKIVDNPVYNIFVAELPDGQVVGTVMFLVTQRFIHQGGKVGHIEDMAVKREFQRKGIGSTLMRAAIEEARKRGCYKIILDCAERNVPFYENLNFRKKEYQMRLDL